MVSITSSEPDRIVLTEVAELETDTTSKGPKLNPNVRVKVSAEPIGVLYKM